MKTSTGPHGAARDTRNRFQITQMVEHTIKHTGFPMKVLWTHSGSVRMTPRGPPYPPSPPERWHRAPKGAPWTAQHESEVSKVGSDMGRGITEIQSGQGSTAVDTPLYFKGP